jgi:hypothetical protein
LGDNIGLKSRQEFAGPIEVRTGGEDDIIRIED